MAEPVSISSGLLTLVTFAAQSSVLLYKTIESYRSHPRNVRDLKEELEALTEVLQTLSKTAERHKDLDLTALKLPLLRCGNICQEFEEAVTKCSSRSGGSKTSFRDWAKLKYMGDGIDEFRRVLAGYKSTINIALADANLRQTSLTVEHLESYKVMLNDTTTDLEDHLKDMDDKLQSIFSRAAEGSDEDAMQIQQMQEERLSAKQCLVVCAQLSAHINQIQPVLMASRNRRSAGPDAAAPAAMAEQITKDGLEGCKDALSATSRRLQEHLAGIVGKMMAASKKTLKSPDEAADLERLQAEWETARLCLDICFRANESVTKVNVNVFENIKADQEVLQFFASTTGRIVHAKDISLGAKGVQFGGQLSDASIQQISREFSPAARTATAKSVPPEIVAAATDGTCIAEFTDRYGPGFKLSPEAASQTPQTGRPG